MKEPQTPGGTRLRALREACGKTQLDVELDANLGIGYLQRLELGKVQHPERDTLDRILATLCTSFIERREVLGLFGYSAGFSVPDEAETRWAIEEFKSQIKQDTLPVYLLDCSHRLLAWNSLVPKLFGKLKTASTDVFMPKVIFDPGYAESVLNAETFFSTQVNILRYEKQRFGDEAWYNSLVDDLRHSKMFDDYWRNTEIRAEIPIRPVAQLKLDLAPGVAQFRLISEAFVQDPRFRVIYYIPTDSATLRQCLEWQG